MPTSTATVTVSFNGPRVTKLPVSTKKKGGPATTNLKHTLATLRSLYNRAAKAFIQRDMVLTYSLITSAFSNLHSPVSSAQDSLNSQRRKWDVLRVTLEATVYTSNTPSINLLPESLQMTLRLSPPSVIATMHTRSLQLFTPSSHSRPTAEFLPPQVLVTLALASVKLDCPQVGREIVEDWLSRRIRPSEEELSSQDPKVLAEALEGYEKVVEVYCLHLLPRLGEWDYIREFLAYERELLEERRMQLLRTVERLHSEYVSGLDRIRQQERVPSVSLSPSSPSPSTSSSRTATPKIVPNTSSSSSSPSPSSPDRTPSPSPSVASASTTSTHTAVPTRRPNGLSAVASSSSATPTSPAPSSAYLQPPRSTTDSTTSTIQRPSHVLSPSHPHKAVSSSHPASSSSLSSETISPSSSALSRSSISQPSLITLIRSSLLPHLTKSKVSFFVIMCLVSIVSYLFRLRRKRLRMLSLTGSSSAGTTSSKLITSHASDLEEVRRRLGGGGSGTGVWAGARRAIYDVARMAVGGLA